MLRLRYVLFALALLILAPLLGGMGAAAWVLWELPPAQGERIRGPHDLIGIQSGGSYVWVLPTQGGVVLIDAGLDPQAAAVKREVNGRPVHAILLTHAHSEQIAGLGAFPDVPVYVGGADVPLLEGESAPKGWLARWFGLLIDQPAPPDPLHTVADQQQLSLDGVTLQAFSTPGHTAGSVVWLWEDVLLTGGAVLASNPPRLLPSALSDDEALAEQSLEALLPLDFDWIADAQTGIVDNARSGLHRLLGQRPQQAEVSLKAPTPPGTPGPTIEQQGVFLQDPTQPDGPALLLLDDGTRWLLSDLPGTGHAALWGRRVVARGQPTQHGRDPGGPAGLGLRLESLGLADDQAPNATGLPSAGDPGALGDLIHQWGKFTGTATQLEPLAQGATHGEGRFSLTDGDPVPLSAPMELPQDVIVTVIARVAAAPEGHRLIVSQICDEQAPCP